MARKHAIDDKDRDSFARAIEGVRPLDGRDEYAKPARKPPARPKKNIPNPERKDDDHPMPALGAQRDPSRDRKGLSLSMAPTEKSLFFQCPGVQDKRMQRLKAGRIPYEDQVNLRYKPLDDAKQSLERFIEDSSALGKRCVLVIHGKGHGSDGGRSIIKENIGKWLKRSHNVMAYCSAQPGDGDTGALYVLLGKSGAAR
ncbi:Smr/MutS family protein [Thioalkalivibrio sp. HK1]|uniref:Smr/MutS family protein n=1 Tax=Thioalkalivibrio sp. HK1 TaxID=1469245 RepID=UPI00046EEDE4|nr:Smr/MutS family protein [Thioalkalivibrio sp. HK1]